MIELPKIVGLNGANEAFSHRLLCPVIFVAGCNMRCPYCLNTDIVLNRIGGSTAYGAPREYTFEEIKQYLAENDETDVIISGGEPLLHKNLPSLIDSLMELGVSVGISTNGADPDALHNLIANHGVSMLAMDVKCDLSLPKMRVIYGPKAEDKQMIEAAESIKSSISYLNKFADREDFMLEYRTTLYPPVVDLAGIESIGGMLHHKSSWVLQQFRPRLGLLGGNWVNEVVPYEDEALDQMLAKAREFVPDTQMRWP